MMNLLEFFSYAPSLALELGKTTNKIRISKKSFCDYTCCSVIKSVIVRTRCFNNWIIFLLLVIGIDYRILVAIVFTVCIFYSSIVSKN